NRLKEIKYAQTFKAGDASEDFVELPLSAADMSDAEYVYFFVSPSAKGLNATIEVSDSENHTAQIDAQWQACPGHSVFYPDRANPILRSTAVANSVMLDDNVVVIVPAQHLRAKGINTAALKSVSVKMGIPEGAAQTRETLISASQVYALGSLGNNYDGDIGKIPELKEDAIPAGIRVKIGSQGEIYVSREINTGDPRLPPYTETVVLRPDFSVMCKVVERDYESPFGIRSRERLVTYYDTRGTTPILIERFDPKDPAKVTRIYRKLARDGDYVFEFTVDPLTGTAIRNAYHISSITPEDAVCRLMGKNRMVVPRLDDSEEARRYNDNYNLVGREVLRRIGMEKVNELTKKLRKMKEPESTAEEKEKIDREVEIMKREYSGLDIFTGRGAYATEEEDVRKEALETGMRGFKEVFKQAGSPEEEKTTVGLFAVGGIMTFLTGAFFAVTGFIKLRLPRFMRRRGGPGAMNITTEELGRAFGEAFVFTVLSGVGIGISLAFFGGMAAALFGISAGVGTAFGAVQWMTARSIRRALLKHHIEIRGPDGKEQAIARFNPSRDTSIPGRKGDIEYLVRLTDGATAYRTKAEITEDRDSDKPDITAVPFDSMSGFTRFWVLSHERSHARIRNIREFFGITGASYLSCVEEFIVTRFPVLGMVEGAHLKHVARAIVIGGLAMLLTGCTPGVTAVTLPTLASLGFSTNFTFGLWGVAALLVYPLYLLVYSVIWRWRYSAWIGSQRQQAAGEESLLRHRDIEEAIGRFSRNVIGINNNSQDFIINSMVAGETPRISFRTSSGDMEGAFLFQLVHLYTLLYRWAEEAQLPEAQRCRVDAFAKIVCRSLAQEAARGSTGALNSVRYPGIPGKVDIQIWGKIEIYLNQYVSRLVPALRHDIDNGQTRTGAVRGIVDELFAQDYNAGIDAFIGMPQANFEISEDARCRAIEFARAAKAFAYKERLESVHPYFANYAHMIPKVITTILATLVLRGGPITGQVIASVLQNGISGASLGLANMLPAAFIVIGVIGIFKSLLGAWINSQRDSGSRSVAEELLGVLPGIAFLAIGVVGPSWFIGIPFLSMTSMALYLGIAQLGIILSEFMHLSRFKAGGVLRRYAAIVPAMLFMLLTAYQGTFTNFAVGAVLFILQGLTLLETLGLVFAKRSFIGTVFFWHMRPSFHPGRTQTIALIFTKHAIYTLISIAMCYFCYPMFLNMYTNYGALQVSIMSAMLVSSLLLMMKGAWDLTTVLFSIITPTQPGSEGVEQ
ncbi:MAG: hypothetical protein ABH885_05510, partial [Candidatus Omnitrophota bacterium]